MFKRGADSMASSQPQDILTKIIKIVSDENNKQLETFEKRFQAIETRQDQLEHRIEQLERQHGHAPGGNGGSSASFVPEFLEIKGFCAWDRRLEHCATRDDATELMKILLPLLPNDLQPAVKPFRLRGMRNYSIQVPVGHSVMREVKGIWADAFKSKNVHGPGNSELYATVQKSPEQRVRYSAMGKLYEFVKQGSIKEQGGIKAFWAPDFCIYGEPAQGPPALIVRLDAENNSIWSEACQLFMGFSSDDAPAKLAAFQRSA